MKTKFNGFEVINDRYGMTIHVVAGDIDLFCRSTATSA